MAKSSKKIKKVQKPEEFSIEDFELNATDKKVFQFALQYPEKTQIEIGKILKITNEQVCKIQSKPAYKQAVADFNKNWIDKLLELKPKAMRKMEELLDCEQPNIAIRAAENILQLDKLEIKDNNKPPPESPY